MSDLPTVDSELAQKQRQERKRKVARRWRVPISLVFTVLFPILAQPTWTSILASLLFVALGLWIRGAAAGNLRKNTALATTGPYAYTRNPLYLGSALLAVGFSLASTRWFIGLVLAAAFYLVYIPTIQSEEGRLRGRYPGYDDYARAVPRLLPRLTPARFDKANDEPSGFAFAVYVKNREYQALLGSIAIYAALAARIVYGGR